jgi:hypothetical protein
MTCHFSPRFVRRLDRGAQFFARDMRVGLERGHAAIRPIIHCLTRILRPGKFRHLKIPTRSIQIRARSRPDGGRAMCPSQRPVLVLSRYTARHCPSCAWSSRRLPNTGGAPRSSSARKVPGYRSFRRGEIRPRKVEEMVVHTDDTRHDRVPAQVQYRGAIAR